MLRFLIYFGIALACFAGAAVVFVAGLLLSTPDPIELRGCVTATMHQVRLCPADKSYIKLKDISPYIRHAVIVSEDGAFYDHQGLDFHELKLSFERNLKEGEFARGGSTITQQLAKNVYLSGEKSLLRKAREALIAVRLEDRLKKDEILEKYLNVVEFGPEVYGVAKATQFYFGKRPSQVSVLEAAWLAFVLPNPKKYSTSFRRRQLTRFATQRLKVIVDRMARFKKIQQAEADIALAQIDRIFQPIEEDPSDETLTAEELQALEETLPSGSPKDVRDVIPESVPRREAEPGSDPSAGEFSETDDNSTDQI